MAGGKLSARQKMINLMYLVFIAMIAMTMTKEVLSAFGTMDEKFANTNELTSSNLMLICLTGLAQKAEEKPQEFSSASSKSTTEFKLISDRFQYIYLEGLKRDIVSGGKYELNSENW